MKRRVARAYGFPAAVFWVVVFLILGYVFQYTTMGITRQPLPMVWPLSVLNVVVAQFPLRELLSPMEGVTERAELSRSTRAAACCLLLMPALLTYVQHSGREFVVFFLCCATLGFIVAAFDAREVWAWTLGVGMTSIAVIFITPLGTAVSTGLGAGLSSGAAAVAFVLGGTYYSLRPRARRRWTVRRPSQ